MFVPHCGTENKPNMEFRMHQSSLHCFDPRDKAFVFLDTVSGHKEGFSQREVKGAQQAKTLHAKLGHPSAKDFKWVIQSDQIKDCPATAQDVETSHEIWGKNVAALKGKTTRKKPIHVARDFMKIPKEPLKLHKEVFLTANPL